MKAQEHQDALDELAKVAVSYEQYLEVTRILNPLTAHELAQQEFIVPTPAPLTFSLTWSDDAILE